MGTTDYSPQEMMVTLARLAHVLEAQVQPLAGLVELMGRPQNVVDVPSDTFEAVTVTFADTSIRQVAPHDLTRRRVTILNSGVTDAYLVADGTATVATQLGGKLPAGAAITLSTAAAVAASFPAGSGTLTLFFENRQPGGTPLVPKVG